MFSVSTQSKNRYTSMGFKISQGWHSKNIYFEISGFGRFKRISNFYCWIHYCKWIFSFCFCHKMRAKLIVTITQFSSKSSMFLFQPKGKMSPPHINILSISDAKEFLLSIVFCGMHFRLHQQFVYLLVSHSNYYFHYKYINHRSEWGI